MKTIALSLLATAAITPINLWADNLDSGGSSAVSNAFVLHQREELALATKDKGFGPQSPRDIDSPEGSNEISFGSAPPYTQLNLCNIHFHKNAEHKGGEFTKYAGNGDGHGFLTGYQYSGELTAAEKAAVSEEICPSEHGSLHPGDTIEAHYVYSSAHIEPGPTLGSCLSESIKNPQLRVEAQVYVLVNDKSAKDFVELAAYGKQDGLYQALNIPQDAGTPVEYAGSTTGPIYNEKGSPFQVSWSVRPKVEKVDIESLGRWCQGNVFNEDHAHGVRNLVENPKLLSLIKK